jgi:thiol:disulfide interchange protein DsbD
VEAAFAEAREKGLPVFIDFYADWCTNCKDFYNLANENGELNGALRTGAVLLKIHDTDEAFHNYAKEEDFVELNIGLPFFAILSPDGELLWKSTNYRDSEGMIREIRRAAASPENFASPRP